MEIFALKVPGPYTTVQDPGRHGYQQFGIPLTGALDSFAYLVANLLVGNPERRLRGSQKSLKITLIIWIWQQMPPEYTC